MKKKIFGLLVIMGLLTACGEIPKLENGQEALVSFEKGDGISVDDFYQEIKTQYGLPVLITMIDTKVLQTTFPDYNQEALDNAEANIKDIRSNYKTDAEFLSDIQTYTGFATIQGYQDYLYLSYYEQHATEEYIKKNITDKQIEKYYKENIKEDIEVSHILITPDVTDKMSEEQKKKAEEDALNTVNTILKELKNTKAADLETKFAELAKEYSEDGATKEKGGSLGRVNTDTLGSTYQALIDAAYSIKDGKYYTEAVKTSLGYHIVLRTKSYEKAELETVKSKIIASIVNEEMQTNSSVAINAMQHYRNELGLKINDSQLNTAFNNYVTNLLSNALNS